MYIEFKNVHLPQPKGASRALQRVPRGKKSSFFLGALFAPFLLLGCTERVVSYGQAQQQQETIPYTKVVDYRIASCDTLWHLNEKDALESSLYWLRVIDCADRIGATQARALVKTLPGNDGYNILKQGILLSSAEPTSAERQQMIDRLNSYRLDFPSFLRPLLQLWRQQQVLYITLSNERARYQHLQESSDNQMDQLRQDQARLQSQLQETSRKLENLTDIERQLSSRKQLQGEIPESSATQSNATQSNATQPNTTQSNATQPKATAVGNSPSPVKAAEPEPTPVAGTALPVEQEDTDAPPPEHKGTPTQ